MKILLVNYRYFISGGPERYYFNIKNILESNGHKVIPFSIKSSYNFPTEYERYFLDSLDDEVYFSQTKKSFRIILKSFSRMFFSFEAKRKFSQLIKDTTPDIVYIIQYHNKISPSIIYAAKSAGIPVVHRISDFQYMCPNALFYNDVNGICEDCLYGHKLHCVKYKCVLSSALYSMIKMMAKIFHDALGVKNKIDAFVVPSSFTLSKLIRYGVPQHKLFHIPTFFYGTEDNPTVEYHPFILYIGRIEKQKGLMTLLKSVIDTNYRLKIIGFSNNGYENDLKKFLEDKTHHVEFLGRKNFNEIVPYLKSCLCTVVPSEWYDNFPNVILESFAYKKAVIATNIGSLPELVENHKTGLLFKYSDPGDLRKKISFMFENREDAEYMGNEAYREISSKYSYKKHYSQLINLFETLNK